MLQFNYIIFVNKISYSEWLNKIKDYKMYRVIIPNTGLVLGVFSDHGDAVDCYRKYYTTATALCPVIEQI